MLTDVTCHKEEEEDKPQGEGVNWFAECLSALYQSVNHSTTDLLIKFLNPKPRWSNIGRKRVGESVMAKNDKTCSIG